MQVVPGLQVHNAEDINRREVVLVLKLGWMGHFLVKDLMLVLLQVVGLEKAPRIEKELLLLLYLQHA